MLSFTHNKSECMGCAACYSICPVQCITMERDEEGFLYPIASDKCINCHLCEKICPIVNPLQEKTQIKTAVIGLSKNHEIWQRSASGGAFSEICRQYADKNTLIVGAAWDGLQVHHIGVLGFSEIAPLCKSKYVSSAIEDTFIEIKKHLKSGNNVIFCGCPCQVDGLKHFLRKDYNNLLTIDLICHGQGSPLVFQESSKMLSKQLGEKVMSYEFRAKRKAYQMDHLSLVKTEKSSYYIVNDRYVQLFLSQDALRPSCGEHCKYRNINRPGDITIADCKGLSKIYPSLAGSKRNYSTIVSNTAKGEQLIKLLRQSMIIKDCTLDDVITYNPLFARHTWFSKNRDAFFKDFEENPTLAIEKWTQPSQISDYTFSRKVFDLLPDRLRRIIYQTVHFFKNNL